MNAHSQLRLEFVSAGVLALVLTLLTACSKKPEEAPAPAPAPAAPAPAPSPSAVSFDVAKLKSEYGVAIKEPYQPVGRLKHEPYRVVVLATWCPYSLKFLEEAKNDPSIAADYLLVVYEDEYSRKVRAEERRGNITTERADALLDAPENRGKMVWDVDPALAFGLPIYVVKSDTFRSEVKGFPTRLLCSSGNCTKTGLALSETKAIIRSKPELIEAVKQQLSPADRARAERNPESLITALATILEKRSARSDE